MPSRVVWAFILGVAAFPGAVYAQNLDVNGTTMTLSGVQRRDNICVRNGGTLIVSSYDGGNKANTGNIELIAGTIYVDATSRIVARGAGYQPALCSDGPGMTSTAGGRGGCSVMDSGGGGAHFGKGGRGTVDNPLSMANVWQSGFPTAFEDDCNINFDSGGATCVTNDNSRTRCWMDGVDDVPGNPFTDTVGASVAGVQYWHNIYDREFGSAGGDKGCRDGDGRSGNPMSGGGGGRVVLVGLSDRNPGSVASPCAAAVPTQGTVRIEGTIDANGRRGCGVGNDSGGGGGGGSVLIVGQNVIVGTAANVLAAGGLGGDTNAKTSPDGADCPSDTQDAGGTCDDCGGGGGGGIISVLSQSSDLQPGATFNVSGALGGVCTICNGEAGGGAGELQLDGAYVGEYCDGYDNDFDGNVDENLGTQSCGVGACAQNIAACSGGAPAACTPMVDPADATCKGAADGARPRVAVILDTSASMLLNLSGYPTFGDGSVERPGIDTPSDADSVANDSRLHLARESLAQVISAYPEIDFALARYHQDQGINRSCQSAKWFECQSLVATYDDPTNNSGAAVCNVNIGPSTTVSVRADPNPAGMPTLNSECINYAGSCGGPRRGADILSGFGSEVRDLVRWLDGRETNFDPSTTAGDVCHHSDGVHDCEVRGSGPTPLAGSLQAVEDYVAPIRAVDSAAMCRGYSVILVTDGAESCNGNPASAAQRLHDMLGIEVYVVAVSVLATEQASLNQIARAGSGNLRDATFVSMPQQLVPALSGIIAGSIRPEKCNGDDDDCDGNIDEDFPSLGADCDDGENGVCRGEGKIECNATEDGTECKLSSSGANPRDETCNALDDDCDDKIDEGLDCGDVPCSPTGSEVCNAKDDDCDGKVDESDPSIDRECGENKGICETGKLRCVAGTLRCIGGVMPGMEQCNGKDDDCNGDIDNEAPCPPTEACIDGACRRECDPLVEFPCPVGFLCKTAEEGNFCLPGACAVCKSSELCENDVCVNPCENVSCADNETCVLGNCKNCTMLPCTGGLICYDKVCQEDTCKDVDCTDSEFCFKGECMPLCDQDLCKAGERCNAAGSCEADRCAAVSCSSGEVCRGGECTVDPCAEISCTLGDVCIGELGCVPDPCPVTVCPDGASCAIGEQGQPVCVAPSTPPKRPTHYISAAGNGLTTACSVTQLGGGSSSPAWLVLPVLVWSWRRRRSRGARSGGRG